MCSSSNVKGIAVPEAEQEKAAADFKFTEVKSSRQRRLQ
jgi:hypothetical protein